MTFTTSIVLGKIKIAYNSLMYIIFKITNKNKLMETSLLNINLDNLFVIIILAMLGIIIYLLSKKKETNDSNSIKLIQDHILHLNKTIDDKLSHSSKIMSDNMNKTFATSTKINEEANKRIEEITKKLTQIDETNKQIKDIWGQLEWLEKILKNPKQRWNLWEYFLSELLENVFTTDQYKLQYTIEPAWIVDAALFIGWKIIPIDSKFPQENYERLIASEDEYSIKKYSSDLKKDLKNRIEETSKYILPENGTTDFAFMLIPAEGLYYDIFINKVWNIKVKNIIEHAFSKKVIICSPSSFYAYLQTVLQWMKALQIEEKAKEIQKYVIKLQKDLNTYEELFWKLWNSLWATINHYNNAYKRLWIIDKDIVKITSWEAWWEVIPLELDKPNLD